ncbi:MAG: helix-turn-helix domain-containing protein [Magnetococcales bacterium]|nr:helix-turn-helix domain-containing protein [Magnetococcales bacterium]
MPQDHHPVTTGTVSGGLHYTEDEVANMLAISKRHVQNMRVTGRGPQFVRIGRCIRYNHLDLLNWLATLPRSTVAKLKS